MPLLTSLNFTYCRLSGKGQKSVKQIVKIKLRFNNKINTDLIISFIFDNKISTDIIIEDKTDDLNFFPFKKFKTFVKLKLGVIILFSLTGMVKIHGSEPFSPFRMYLPRE